MITKINNFKQIKNKQIAESLSVDQIELFENEDGIYEFEDRTFQIADESYDNLKGFNIVCRGLSDPKLFQAMEVSNEILKLQDEDIIKKFISLELNSNRNDREHLTFELLSTMVLVDLE